MADDNNTFDSIAAGALIAMFIIASDGRMLTLKITFI